MSKKKDKKKYVHSIIEDIRKLTEITIPAEFNQGQYATVQQYIDNPRTALNILLVEAMLGCEMSGDKVKFNHHLPSKSDISEVCQILQDFIDRVESPILKSFADKAAAADGKAPQQPACQSDMGIPKMEISINGTVNRISMIDKVDNKKLKEELLGKDMVRRVMLNTTDCLKLAAMGETSRKKDSRNKMLIVGGIVLLLTGAAVAGVLIYNKKHSDDELKVGDDIVDGDIPDISDGDIPEIEDNPQVDID